jgi:hypothetical protein
MIVAAFISAILSAATPQAAASQEGLARPVRHEMPRPTVEGDRAEIPLELDHGMPAFMLSIGGQKFKLGFDTGAMGGPHLMQAVPNNLKLDPIGEAFAGDPSGKNLVPIKLYRLPTVELGALRIRDWIATGSAGPLARIGDIDGVIGLGAFDGFVVTLDYAGRRLLLERGSLSPPNGRSIFAYNVADAVPSVPVTVEGKTLLAHVDTGNVAFAFIVPTHFAQGLSGYAQARTIGVAHTISNVMEIKAVPLTSNALVGTVPLAAREVGFPSVIDLGNIGSLALSTLIVRIDPKNHRIEISRPMPSI